jgi:hypothetical protein
MRYRDIEYSVVQGIGRHIWKWSVSFDADHQAVGQEMTKAEAFRRPSAPSTGLRPRSCGWSPVATRPITKVDTACLKPISELYHPQTPESGHAW